MLYQVVERKASDLSHVKTRRYDSSFIPLHVSRTLDPVTSIISLLRYALEMVLRFFFMFMGFLCSWDRAS